MLRLIYVALGVSLLWAGSALADDGYGDNAADNSASLAGVAMDADGSTMAAVMPAMPGDQVMPDGSTWTTTLAFLRQTLSQHTAAVTALAVTPDGSTMFTGGKDGHLMIWDLATGDLLQQVQACNARINDIAVS